MLDVYKHVTHTRSHSVEHDIHSDGTLNMHLSWPSIHHACRKSRICALQVRYLGDDTSRRCNELLN
jgi:hypothetical protein